jgi:hypothetical protein
MDGSSLLCASCIFFLMFFLMYDIRFIFFSSLSRMLCSNKKKTVRRIVNNPAVDCLPFFFFLFTLSSTLRAPSYVASVLFRYFCLYQPRSMDIKKLIKKKLYIFALSIISAYNR